VPIIK